MPIACSVHTAVMYYLFIFSPLETVPTRIVERVNYCTARTENRERNVICNHAVPILKQILSHLFTHQSLQYFVSRAVDFIIYIYFIVRYKINGRDKIIGQYRVTYCT